MIAVRDEKEGTKDCRQYSRAFQEAHVNYALSLTCLNSNNHAESTLIQLFFTTSTNLQVKTSLPEISGAGVETAGQVPLGYQSNYSFVRFRYQINLAAWSV